MPHFVLDILSGQPMYCLYQLKPRIITKIGPSFAGCLSTDL
jgi:hypothetical protein